MYTENLLHLLHLLEISGQNGTLSCSSSANAKQDPWQALCLLDEGKIREIRILNPVDGHIFFEGQKALQWLKMQGGLYWQIKEAPPPELFPTRPVVQAVSDDVPRRTPLGVHLGVQGITLREWSREHRVVFLLIDGVRSRAEILRLLASYPERTIQGIFSDLQTAGLIE